MVVDFQHHYVPEQLAREKGLYSDKVTVATEGGVPRMTLHAKLYDAEAQLRDMDEAGVDVSVVSCHLGWDGSLEDCRVINDSYAELEQQYSGRFVGLAHAPVLEGDKALDELDRAILERGLHGVTITSQVGRPLSGLLGAGQVLRPGRAARRPYIRAPGAGAQGV